MEGEAKVKVCDRGSSLLSAGRRLLVVAALLLVSAVAGSPGPARAATGDELLYTCLTSGLQKPSVVRPLVLVNAGIWPGTNLGDEQALHGTFEWSGMPEECGMRYARTAKSELEMLRKGVWGAPRYVAGFGGLKRGRQKVSTYGGHPDIPASAPYYNTCSGGRFHRMRVMVVTTITRPALQTVEGRKAWTYPVLVHGDCAKAALSEQRVHKLQEELFGSRFTHGRI